MQNKKSGFTVTGTNIQEVKELNAKSGLTYNQIKELIAKEYLSRHHRD
ncbi:hypothetical protein [Bacillus testis]|nr:hypothetical protein [Bacillus testis]